MSTETRRDVEGIKWTVEGDDPLIADPATAPIAECIGLVMGELGDERRAASAWAALRDLRRENEVLRTLYEEVMRHEGHSATDSCLDHILRAARALTETGGE